MCDLPMTYVRINLDNLKSNYAYVRDIAGDSVKIMSVVKADGYGHGASTVSKALVEAGSDCLAVASLEEAIAIRDEVSVDVDIFTLSDSDPEKMPEIIRHRLTPVVFDLDQARALDDAAKSAGTILNVHLKFDTTMGRLGFFPEETGRVVAELNKLSHLNIDGMMSHFPRADDDDTSYSYDQLRRFNTIIAEAASLGISPKYKHIANSAAIINLKDSHLDMVRPGIMLYGSPPSGTMSVKAELRPVMSLHTRIISIKEFAAGKSISYSHTFTTQQKSTIAVLPIGYADGLPRLLSNKGHVLVNGMKAPIVGNVTMDLTMVDITGIHSVKVGDEATVIGEVDGERIDAWDIADIAGTISYEVFTGISKRVPRIT